MFVSDSAELYSISAFLDEDSSVPEGKLDSFLKIRLSVLNFVFLPFIDRLSIFVSYTKLKKSKKFFYDDLGVQGVITYFYDSSKKIGILLHA